MHKQLLQMVAIIQTNVTEKQRFFITFVSKQSVASFGPDCGAGICILSILLTLAPKSGETSSPLRSCAILDTRSGSDWPLACASALVRTQHGSKLIAAKLANVHTKLTNCYYYSLLYIIIVIFP